VQTHTQSKNVEIPNFAINEINNTQMDVAGRCHFIR